MPLIGEDDDIPLWVPGPGTSFLPSAAPFVTAQNSVLREMKRILRRMRSQVLYLDKFEASGGWDAIEQKLRVVGETQGYFELTIQRKQTKVTVPPDGNFEPIVLGSITDERLTPQSLASLGSTKTGRLAAGHVLSSGEVKLDAINSGSDIEVGDIITLAGGFPMDHWLDSEV